MTAKLLDFGIPQCVRRPDDIAPIPHRNIHIEPPLEPEPPLGAAPVDAASAAAAAAVPASVAPVSSSAYAADLFIRTLSCLVSGIPI